MSTGQGRPSLRQEDHTHRTGRYTSLTAMKDAGHPRDRCAMKRSSGSSCAGPKTFGVTEIAGTGFQHPPAPNRADLQPKKKILKHENECPLNDYQQSDRASTKVLAPAPSPALMYRPMDSSAKIFSHKDPHLVIHTLDYAFTEIACWDGKREQSALLSGARHRNVARASSPGLTMCMQRGPGGQSLVLGYPRHSVLTMSPHDHTQEAVQTDGSSEGLGMEERLTHHQEVFDGPRNLCQATIHVLPEDVLLEIFDFYLDDENPYEPCSADQWHALVHVCQIWRSVVFASPFRLNLRLLCTGDRPVRAMRDVWPTLPIQIHYHGSRAQEIKPLDNIIAALEHRDRVRHISITNVPGAWEMLAAAMQVPFPELTYLELGLYGTSVSFLSGVCAPRLRTLELKDIPFPAVRNLILSAGDLVNLTLLPHLFASPESVVACLSSLKRLESLWLGLKPFQSGSTLSPLPQERVVLPALAKFSFEGMRWYLEDFVARIDTPVLSQLHMSAARDFVYSVPHLRQFIDRTRGLKQSKTARVLFDSSSLLLEFLPRGSTLRVVREGINWQLSIMALVCGKLSPFFSLVERLDLVVTHSPAEPRLEDGIKPTLFLDLFQPFATIQGLYVSESLAPLIAPALQELIGERATEVLPNLRDLFLGGPVTPGSVQEAIQPFVDARRLSGQPVAIHRWEEKEE
ncbi:hypothetical protein BC826DRAFT_973438 [Russula brevipes]|nr:hypothetical protein BC826DRAFT_973438 [Russula brevipes]